MIFVACFNSGFYQQFWVINMKNTHFITVCFLAISLLLAASCSDDSPTKPSADKTYLPTTNGTYWLSEVYTLDTNGRLDTQPYYDSLIVSGTETKLEKLANVFNGFISQNRSQWSANRTEYYYIERNKIYTHSDIFKSIFGLKLDEANFDLPIEYPNEWYLFIDPNSNSWQIDTLILSDIPIELLGTTRSVDATIIIRGSKGNTETVTFKGQQYTAQIFNIEFSLDGKIDKLLPVKISRKLSLWMVDGLGFFKTKNEAFIVPYINYMVLGMERYLIDFHKGE